MYAASACVCVSPRCIKNSWSSAVQEYSKVDRSHYVLYSKSNKTFNNKIRLYFSHVGRSLWQPFGLFALESQFRQLVFVLKICLLFTCNLLLKASTIFVLIKHTAQLIALLFEKLQDHRIRECVGLKTIFKGHLA